MGSETLPSACYILLETLPSACYILSKNLVYPFTLRVTGSENTRRMTPYLLKSYVPFKSNSKEERYSRVPRLSSDTRYSANGAKGKWRYTSSKARLNEPTYRRYTDLSVLDQSIGNDETNTFQLKFFIDKNITFQLKFLFIKNSSYIIYLFI